MIYYTNSADETQKIGRELAEKLDTGLAKRAFIAMRGEMGVGKTAFTAGFAEHFGIRTVKSPTYAIMNQYTSPRGVRIYHFDMYRILDEDELYSIGYDDYSSREGFIIVEWSENIEYAIPEGAVFVTIERMPDSENSRKITVEGID